MRDTESMHCAKLIVWLSVALTVGCDSNDERGANDGAGGMGGGHTSAGGLPGVGESTVPAPGWMPGGDTSDLGQPSLTFCRGWATGTEVVSFEEARERGFGPEALRSQIEGVFEADVRWDEPASRPATRVKVELVNDASAKILGWNCGLGPPRAPMPGRAPDESLRGYPPCFGGDRLGLDLHVSIATADETLRASFVTLPVTHKHSGEPSIRYHSDDEVLFSVSSLSAQQLLQAFSLEPSHLNTKASLSAFMLTARGHDLRVQIRVLIWDAAGTSVIREVYAWPADGCSVWSTFHEERETEGCTPARFGGGYCCGGGPRSWEGEQSQPPQLVGTDLACLAPDPENDAGRAEAESDAGTDPN